MFDTIHLYLFTYLGFRKRVYFPIGVGVSILLCLTLIILCFVRRVPHLRRITRSIDRQEPIAYFLSSISSGWTDLPLLSLKFHNRAASDI